MTKHSLAVRSTAALVLAMASTAPASANLHCYRLVPATMLTTVTSASGYSGQVFRFKTTAAALSDGAHVPAGTPGYGIVLSAVPASNRARNGIIVLEARYLLLNGRQIQVTGDPADASILSHGASAIGLGAGAIPVPGLGLAVNEAIRGTDITIGPGYNFHVVPIGDLLDRGPCVERAAAPPSR